MFKPIDINVLLACEESQECCKAFRKLGFNAYSCDTQDCSGGFPMWHIRDDVRNVLKGKWHLIIAFPPCTYLSDIGNRWFAPEYNQQLDLFKGKYGRHEKRKEAFEFFMEIYNTDCMYMAVENPKGIVNTWFRKPDQIIHPYYFGDPERKRTCLWLRNLPKLERTSKMNPPEAKYHTSTRNKPVYFTESLGSQAKKRSKTFPGIAKAMAQQWGNYVLNKVNENEIHHA